MKNKKSIMTFSALQILIFHLWVYVLKNNEIEIFLKQTSYIGVDIFFLISAYSLSSRNVDHYGKFLLFRFKAVYVKYIIFATVAMIYSSWGIERLINIITCNELFTKGGGAYLWFLPAIMIFYIVFPLFQRCENKYKIITPVVITALWVVGAFVITNNTELEQLAIVWNRVPIFIVGYYLFKLNKITNILDNKKCKLIVGTILSLVGTLLIYFYAFKVKLQVPFKDSFYLVVIPASLGLVMLLDCIPENKVIKWIGSSTLEIYAIQMTFGYDIANKLIKLTNNMLIYNILMIIYIVVLSVITHYCYEYLIEKGRKLKNVVRNNNVQHKGRNEN